MKELENLKELYLDEIKAINKKGTLTPADSAAAKEALEAIRKIDEMCGEESNGLSMAHNRYSHNDGYSTLVDPYGNQVPYDGYSERRGRNAMGRYTSRRSYGGYFRHSDVDSMIDRLEDMKREAPDEETARAIDRCIMKLETR